MHTGSAGQESEPLEFAAGVATFNDAGSIAPLLQAIERGLAAAFPSGRFAIVQADAGSRDGTNEAARAAVAGDRLIQTQVQLDPLAGPGVLGAIPPPSLRCVLEEARRRNAGGCVILEARSRQVPSRWVELLARPVASGAAGEGLDFVAPYYRQHPFDRAITSGIAFPLQRALYGRPLRFPLTSDFALSARFLDDALAAWPASLGAFGAGVWLVTRALTGDFRIGQVHLGVEEPVATTGDTLGGSDLTVVLVEVLRALFSEVERHADFWQKPAGRRNASVAVLGEAPDGDPVPVAVDTGRAVEAFRLGQRSLGEVWRLILPPASLLELAKLALGPDGQFTFSDRLWARVVYDFALAFRLRLMNRDHLLAAFVPLYQAWLGSFALEMGAPDPERAERRIEALCSRFEAEKPYFISRWRWPDRFTP